MKKQLLCFTMLVFGCGAIFSQQSPSSTSSTASQTAQQQSEKRAEIRKLIELTGAANVSGDALKQIIAPIRQTFPQVPEKFWEEFTKEIDPQELVDLIVPIYDQYYTLDDIHALTQFYQSPVGQKTIKVLPQLSAQAIDAGQQWGKTVAERAMRKLKQQGYDKTSSRESSGQARQSQYRSR
ncbi:MAG TPA: DUF2059 domain-containing protein [Terriglobales bacterium]|nr:DUF2059 domain-containing protein [Terriglobales bacterium]